MPTSRTLDRNENATLDRFTGRTGLSGWLGSLARAHAAGVDVLFLGDSLFEAQGATARANSTPHRAVAALRRRFGITGGYGYLSFAPRGTITSTISPDITLATSGNVVASSGYGLGRLTANLGTDSGAGAGKATITVQNHTSVTIVGTSNGSGTTFTVVLDGSTTVFSGHKGASGTEWEVPVTLPSRGSHTIEVTFTGASSALYVQGAMFYDGDETVGIRGWNGAKAGATAYDLTPTGGNSTWANAVTRTSADVVVYDVLTNDCLTRTATQYRQDVIDVITLIRTKIANVPILLAPPQERWQYPSGPASVWSAYIDAIEDIAATTPGVAYTDLGTRLARQDYTVNTYGLMSDTTHLGDKGYALWGEYLAADLAHA